MKILMAACFLGIMMRGGTSKFAFQQQPSSKGDNRFSQFQIQIFLNAK